MPSPLSHPRTATAVAGATAIALRLLLRRQLALSPPHPSSPLDEPVVTAASSSGEVVIALRGVLPTLLDDDDDDALGAPVLLRGGAPFPPSLLALWRDGLLCDLEAAVGATSFRVHRLVLAAGSAVFRALFCEGAQVGRLRVANLSADAFEAVLCFLYAGECELPSARLLVPLLDAATRLKIGALQDAAASAISQRLLPSNCVGAWAIAEEYQLQALGGAARAVALRAFETLRSRGALAQLQLRQLCMLLREDELRTDAEETVFEAVVAWHGAQRPRPAADDLVPLLSLVRFPLMDPAYVREHVMSSSLMQSPAAKDVLTSALLAELGSQGPRNTAKRLRAEAIYLAGGMSVHGLKQVDRLCDGKWEVAAAMPTARIGACGAVLGDTMYLIGGTGGDETPLASVDVFDSLTGKWSAGPPLRLARTLASVLALDGRLYVCGGKDGSGAALASVELLDAHASAWADGPTLPSGRFGCAAAPLCGEGFLCGGFAGGGLSCVLRLGPAGWSDGVPMLSPRYNGCAAAAAGRLLVAGGCVHDSHGASASAELYDAAAAAWAAAPLMSAMRMGAAAAAVGGVVYVMGGMSGDAPLGSVEAFDVRSAEWEEAPPLVAPRAGASAAVLRL
ncbi:hypothetical protein AB1Y20_016237 [Prymnesium parvum]|uniref:BTB domain-containing protein n=1 Tax=Prymnesium parvum TaxID=97485 RepID=A0AB34IEJ6_PRYPA